MASDSMTVPKTTTPMADASSVDIYGATGTSAPSDAFGDAYTTPDETMTSTINETLGQAKSGTMSTTTGETTTEVSPSESDYEYRRERSRLSSFDSNSDLISASTGEETVDGQSDALAQEYPQTQTSSTNDHYNELFADAKYNIGDMKYS